MNSLFLIGVTFFFICSISGVHSLQCYQCNSKDDNDCEDLKENSPYLKPCGGEEQEKDSSAYVVCRKMDQWVDFELEDNKPFKRVIRQCGTEKDEKKCWYKAGFGGRVNSCDCETDGCNGASTTTILPIVVLITLAIASYARA